MMKFRLSLRVAGPTILVSLLLFGLCTTMILFLTRQQSRTAELLEEDVGSRRVAQELEVTLNNLISLLGRRSSEVEALHDKVEELLEDVRFYADKEEEMALLQQLEAGLHRYFQRRRGQRVEGRPWEPDVYKDSIDILKTQTVPLCRKLRSFNAQQIERSEAAHQRTVRWMKWGLAGVGTVGALAGITLGYGVARGLRQSLYQLSVRIRDAADRLGQDLPTVTLNRDGNLEQLHEQMRRLVRDIEKVVETLQAREREVLRAEQLAAVGQLAAGAAHELRNPLTAIKMLIQAKGEECDGAGLPLEDVAIIEQEVRRMERCLQTFIDFARLPRPERRCVDLRSIVTRSLALLGGRAHKQQTRLVYLAPDQTINIDADGDQIQQILVNIILNALDVLPRGGLIEIRLLSLAAQAELCVLDNGPGIAATMLPRLFTPFASSKETGLGLGLVVSRRLAEAHGGTLTAANRPTRGAAFALRLPLAV